MPADAQTLAEQALKMQADAVPVLGAAGVLWLLLALLAFGSSGVLSQAARVGVRLGIDAGRTAARWAGLLRLGGWMIVGVVALRAALGQLSDAAELGLLLGLFGLFAVTGMFRDAAGSLHAQFRLRLSEGDRIVVGTWRGQIRRISWDHLTLRAEDGEAILVPGRALLSEAVEVQALRDAVRLERSLPVSLDADALARFTDAVSVCPYRVPGTPVSVRVAGTGLQVDLYVWSAKAVEPAEALLRHTAQEIGEPEA